MMCIIFPVFFLVKKIQVKELVRVLADRKFSLSQVVIEPFA